MPGVRQYLGKAPLAHKELCLCHFYNFFSLLSLRILLRAVVSVDSAVEQSHLPLGVSSRHVGLYTLQTQPPRIDRLNTVARKQTKQTYMYHLINPKEYKAV